MSDYAKRLYAHHVAPELPERVICAGSYGTTYYGQRKHLP